MMVKIWVLVIQVMIGGEIHEEHPETFYSLEDCRAAANEVFSMDQIVRIGCMPQAVYPWMVSVERRA